MVPGCGAVVRVDGVKAVARPSHATDMPRKYEVRRNTTVPGRVAFGKDEAPAALARPGALGHGGVAGVSGSLHGGEDAR